MGEGGGGSIVIGKDFNEIKISWGGEGERGETRSSRKYSFHLSPILEDK